MRHPLTRHPDSRCDAVTNIEVDVARPRFGELELRYRLVGTIGDVHMPSRAESRGELWRHTCLEAFVRATPSDGYYEFNFAPSRVFTVRRFHGYRVAMDEFNNVIPARTDRHWEDASWVLDVVLPMDQARPVLSPTEIGEPAELPDLRPGAEWRLGLSAVIEETNGRISYWALRHPPGKADFHHPDCFALELPAALQP